MPQEFIVQGRIVAGHPAKLRPKKDVRTKQPIIKDGQPVNQIYFALAVEKQYFNSQILPLMQAEVKAAFPAAQPNPAVLGGLIGIPTSFAWKYKDGDGVDANGRPYSSREGYAGHCVINYTTEGFAPQLFKQEGTSYRQMQEHEVKCGDYVAVKTSIKFNGASVPNTPGLYVNPNMILHVGYGAEIVSSGQDPDEAFAGFQVQLPPGASATPIAGAMPPAMVVPTAAPVVPVVPVAAPLPPAAPDFVQNVIAPVVFPPAGWTAHPQAPGFFYMGTEVLSEQQLRERMAIPGLPAGR